MSKLLNKVFNFVGWEAVDEEEDEFDEQELAVKNEVKEEPIQTHFFNSSKKQQTGKVVNFHTGNQ
ncbi:MAG TPA: cell division protein SepF, partial [Ruminiclostridium sp.]|nr:cell division protein SepF [Ruminiclostridium sp.]